VAGALEQGANELADVRVVVHNEDSVLHTVFIPLGPLRQHSAQAKVWK
jgi:hypothetical protein